VLRVEFGLGLFSGPSPGAGSPLQGIYTAELVETEHLGLLLGVQQTFYGIAGAAGPIVAGALLTATGSWTSTLVLTAVAFVIAALVLAPRGGS
jgi:MFS family permease